MVNICELLHGKYDKSNESIFTLKYNPSGADEIKLAALTSTSNILNCLFE